MEQPNPEQPKFSFPRRKRFVRSYAAFAGTFTSMLIGVSIFTKKNDDDPKPLIVDETPKRDDASQS